MNPMKSAAPGRHTRRQARCSSWFARGRNSSHDGLAMYCFPYAGGNGTAFLPWQADLQPLVQVIGVQLPARGPRIDEDPFATVPQLAEALANAIALEGIRPFALYGHSLGALVAFEVSRYLCRHRMPEPAVLVVSGCDAPPHRKGKLPLHQLEGDAFIEGLATYGGTPPEVLQHDELLEMVTPIIQADFRMSAAYSYEQGDRPLDIPIVALCGNDDPFVDPQTVTLWQNETSRPLSLHWFDGDHFFIKPHKHLVTACLLREFAARHLI